MTEFWGADHATGKRVLTSTQDVWVPENNVKLFKQEIDKHQRQVRLALEVHPDQLAGQIRTRAQFVDGPTVEYWDQVHEHATVLHEVVPLEGSTVAKALVDLENILANTVEYSYLRNPKEFTQTSGLQTPTKITQALLEHILKRHPELNVRDLEKVKDAVSVTRSVDMKTESERQKADIALMGSVHVQDLADLFGAEHRYLGERKATGLERLDHYREYRTFVEELKEIARNCAGRKG